MRPSCRASRRLHWGVVAVASPLLLAVFWWASGGLFNISASLPYGLYHAVNEAPQVGRLVAYCLPVAPLARQAHARGYLSDGRCSGGWLPILKPVVAMAGDHVQFLDAGVLVNGRWIANSARIAHDPSGHRLPAPQPSQQYLRHGELLLISSYSAHSFDGRYFGVVPADGVQAVVVPVITWPAGPAAHPPPAAFAAPSFRKTRWSIYDH